MFRLALCFVMWQSYDGKLFNGSGYHGAWHWLGNTLNPYYEGNSRNAMIPDDRFIYDTLTDWFFGENNTGDIMDRANLAALIRRVSSQRGKFHLVTCENVNLVFSLRC